MSHIHDNFWDDCENIEKPKKFTIQMLKDNLRKRTYRRQSKNKEKFLSKNLSGLEIRNKLYNDGQSRNIRIKKKSNEATLEEKNRETFECTFHPKVLKIKSASLKSKIDNYSKWNIYDRNKVFQMKKRENALQIQLQQRLNYSQVYNHKPKINRRKKSVNKQTEEADNSTIGYYERMNNARTERIINEVSQLTDRTNYYQKNYEVHDVDAFRKRFRKIFPRCGTVDSREVNDFKKTLHSTLMNLSLDSDDEEYK